MLGRSDLRWRFLLILGAAVTAGGVVCRGQAPIEPLRVCDVLENLSAHDGKVVAIQGRYSFRENGRFLGEDTCGRALTANDVVWPNALRVVFDPKTAPAPALRVP